MKKTLFLLATCLLASIFVTAQDLKLDEILNKFNTAAGQDKLSKVNTIKMVGKMSMMGMELPMTMLRKRPSKMRSEVEFQGNKIISTFNGTEGYTINPMMGSSEAQKAGDDQIKEFKSQASLDNKFFNYKENGDQLELAGVEDVNGKKAYKLKLIEKATQAGNTGTTTYHFIDCENFTLVKSTMTIMNMQGVETEAEMYYSNYKPIDGVPTCYTMEIKTGGSVFMTMNYDEIKVNEDLPDALFEKPSN